MTGIGMLVRERRRCAKLTQEQLAERAAALPGAPPDRDWLRAVQEIENRRALLRLNDPDEPLWYFLKVLAVSDAEALAAIRGRAA